MLWGVYISVCFVACALPVGGKVLLPTSRVTNSDPFWFPLEPVFQRPSPLWAWR